MFWLSPSRCGSKKNFELCLMFIEFEMAEEKNFFFLESLCKDQFKKKKIYVQDWLQWSGMT